MENSTKKFGIVDKLGYMFGDFGNDFTFLLASMALMKFYTDVMGVSAAIVGLLMMVSKFVDAVTDVIMGQIADRSKPTAKGKFLPWIRRMMGPVALASFLMYATWFQNMPMWFIVFWLVFTYLLWGSVCYTGINIPYGSMASAITGNPSERAQLSVWRSLGGTLAGTMIGIVLPLVVYYKNAAGNTVISGTNMAIFAFICSVGALICYMLCYKMTTERVKMEQTTEKFNLSELLKSLATNKSLIGIIVCSILLLLSSMAMSGLGAYIFPNYFGNAAAQSMATLLGTAITLVCAFFTARVFKKMGRKELAIAVSSFSATMLIITYVVHTHDVIIYMILYLLTMAGTGIYNQITWAMITDVIDDTEVKQGKREDGTIYSVYSFARKLGQALASGLTGALLGVAGYSQATAFDTNVVNNIYNINCLAPAAGLIALALALIFLYPLNKKKVEENARILSEKQANH